MYTTKDGTKKVLESLNAKSLVKARYSRITSADGSHYFLLKVTNIETIGKSETYNSPQAMENGIQAVMRVGPDALVNDKI